MAGRGARTRTSQGWFRRRSAPVGVLLAGAFVLTLTAAFGVIVVLLWVRPARGLPSYTAGLPRTTLSHPLARRAVYPVVLEGPPDRESPGGRPTAAHRWEVFTTTAPRDALCSSIADDALMAHDATARIAMVLPVPTSMFRPQPMESVPARVAATCAAAIDAQHAGLTVRYREAILARDTPVEIVACASTPPATVLGDCDDGAPTRIYPVEPPIAVRVRLRGALERVLISCLAFVTLCLLAGLATLRVYDRQRGRVA